MKFAIINECVINFTQDDNDGIEIWNAKEKSRVFLINKFVDIRIIDIKKISLKNKIVNYNKKVLFGISHYDKGERK